MHDPLALSVQVFSLSSRDFCFCLLSFCLRFFAVQLACFTIHDLSEVIGSMEGRIKFGGHSCKIACKQNHANEALVIKATGGSSFAQKVDAQ